jgi:hypothetical protein
MKSVKTIATAAAFVLALSAHAFAQGSLGNSGTTRGSAVQSVPSAVESSKGAVESTPSSGSGFGSRPTSDSALTTPNENPNRGTSTTSGANSPAENNGSSTRPNSR